MRNPERHHNMRTFAPRSTWVRIDGTTRQINQAGMRAFMAAKLLQRLRPLCRPNR